MFHGTIAKENPINSFDPTYTTDVVHFPDLGMSTIRLMKGGHRVAFDYTCTTMVSFRTKRYNRKIMTPVLKQFIEEDPELADVSRILSGHKFVVKVKATLTMKDLSFDVEPATVEAYLAAKQIRPLNFVNFEQVISHYYLLFIFLVGQDIAKVLILTFFRVAIDARVKALK